MSGTCRKNNFKTFGIIIYEMKQKGRGFQTKIWMSYSKEKAVTFHSFFKKWQKNRAESIHVLVCDGQVIYNTVFCRYTNIKSDLKFVPLKFKREVSNYESLGYLREQA